MVETIYTDADGYKLKFNNIGEGGELDIQIEISDRDGSAQFYDIDTVEDLDAIIRQLSNFSKEFKEENK